MDFGRENSLFPLILIQVKSAAKRTVFGLKDKREKAFLPFKTQLFHIQVVRYAAMELQRRNFPLSTISFWACGNNKLKAKDLVASLKTREMPQCLQEADGWCAKSRKWFEAASEKFTAKFLAKKYLITFIQDGYNAADDASAYTSEMEEKLKNLTQWQADKIQNARKTSTQTQEQIILDLLREHL